MASSEALAIERVTSADVDAALALSDAAGWNQTAADWAFFIGHGEVTGMRDEGGVLVATAAALPYDGNIGWVSMVLVDPAQRHRGVATRLVGIAVDALRRRGRVPVLDATAAGAEVYRRLGFASGFAFHRWEGEGDVGAIAFDDDARQARDMSNAPSVSRALEISGADGVASCAERFAALDRVGAGFDRGPLLRDLLARPTSRAWLGSDGASALLARAGRRATQIGPVYADGAEAATRLVERALAATPGRIFIDVPAERPALERWLERRGFARQRSFVRMALVDGAGPGRAGVPAQTANERAFALAGPEFG